MHYLCTRNIAHYKNCFTMKRVILTGLFALFLTNIFAQSNELLNLRIEARGDYQHENVDGDKVNDNCGFKGRFLNIRMDGNISEEFSYSYRQRLNKPNKDATFFDATDWIYLTYTKNNWSISAGKLVVGLGGYEYDRAPIDIYFASEYWNNIPCYRLGASVTFTTDSKRDKFVAQICESPFRSKETNTDNEEMFAYNLLWYGSHGWFNTIYSLNMIEYMPEKYISYIILGHKINFGEFSLELDIINRALSGHAFLGKDLSVIGELMWSPTNSLNLFTHISYDVNNTDKYGDFCVMPDTEITRAGLGLEFFPIKGSKDVRLHLNGCYTWGNNSNPLGVLTDKQTVVDAGVTWKMNLLSFKRR